MVPEGWGRNSEMSNGLGLSHPLGEGGACREARGGETRVGSLERAAHGHRGEGAPGGEEQSAGRPCRVGPEEAGGRGREAAMAGRGGARRQLNSCFL